VPLGGSPFPPIAEYAFLSDTEVTALVAPSGNVEWMCLPRMDSPSVFGAILDRDAGCFKLAPADTTVPAGRRYVPGTMMVETTWATRTGWVIVRDVLLIGPWHNEEERSGSFRRSPTDSEADHVLLRTMRCVNGSVEMHLDCQPMLDYGRAPVRWEYANNGYHKAIGRAPGHDLELRLTTDLRLGFEGGRALARRTLREGDLASWPCRGATTARPRPSRRPTNAWSTPPTTGTSGSRAAPCPTTRGGRTCSAARSRSRASSTPPPVR
jgi:GH15 family glucan-1,4-alpha-glucosidase